MMQDLYQMPGHLVRRVQQISVALFAEQCGEFDLTSVQFAALFAIKAHHKLDATRLSQLIAYDRSTIGDVLNRLEKKGWICRTPCATDRRIKLVKLSAAGRKLLVKVEPAVRRVQVGLLEPLRSEEKTQVLALLGKLSKLDE